MICVSLANCDLKLETSFSNQISGVFGFAINKIPVIEDLDVTFNPYSRIVREHKMTAILASFLEVKNAGQGKSI
jgi:hypothetical protein